MNSKVYFTKEITSAKLVEIFEKLCFELKGKVAVKISTGEAKNPNHLNPELIKDLVEKLNGSIVECNTAYSGKRDTTEAHMKTAEKHGFTKIAKVDIMDSEGDITIPVPHGRHIKENFVGKNLENYDSMLMLSHFKGHPMGGFGGALKNMSIGVASRDGKAWIHSAGKVKDAKIIWKNTAPQDTFLEAMAEAASSVINYMQGNIVYINVINNLTVDCDCVAHPKPVCMQDIGIVASLDPVAVDTASVDLIYNSNDEGKDYLIERIERQNGRHILDYAEELGLGSKNYELISID